MILGYVFHGIPVKPESYIARGGDWTKRKQANKDFLEMETSDVGKLVRKWWGPPCTITRYSRST